MSPLTAYRRLFSLAGPLYVVTAFLGRLPLAMSQMGALLLVSGTTGSYAAGGLAAGSLAVANAAGSPLGGWLADRHGQRPVVLVQSIVGGVGLAALVVVATGGAPTSAVVAVAALTGLFLPQVGPLARVRWRPITARAGEGSGHLVSTAFSYEGAADAASFVLGPALLGILVAAIAPEAGLLFASALLVVFGCAFALHPTARLTHAARHHAATQGRLWSAGLLLLLLAQLLIGSMFGSVQTGTTALAVAAGHAGVAGIVHSLLGVGSVVAGVALAAVPERISLPRRAVVAACALLVLSLPLLLVGSLGSLIAVVLLLGFAVAPYMITNFTIGERVVPPTRVGATMTLLAAATGLGYAVGSGLAGRLADDHGQTGAFVVTVAAAAVSAVVVALSRPTWRSALALRGTQDAAVRA